MADFIKPTRECFEVSIGLRIRKNAKIIFYEGLMRKTARKSDHYQPSFFYLHVF